MNEFKKYLTYWNLITDGEPIITNYSKLVPVRYNSRLAMLKIALSPEECTGGELMVWWNGQGAAQILAHQDNAFLMERSISKNSLVTMAKEQDDEASHIICDVVSKLHAHGIQKAPSSLIPLTIWFKSLHNVAIKHGGLFSIANQTALELLNTQQEPVVLHGDIHHSNILDFGERGWLAIDPKGLIGERTYDYANIFCNPDFELATKAGRLEQQVNVVAQAAGLDRSRLIKWILAYAGLSAAWHIEDGSNPELALAVGNIALSVSGK